MPHMVYEYCRTCPSCQAIKASNQKPLGMLQPMPIPKQKWSSVSFDLITHLPKTKRGHTAIANFVDRATKMLICEPTTDEATAEDLALLYYKAVFRFHGIPSQLVTDRDPKFTSKFWKAFHAKLGTSFNMSTANHPQTDGQTERANRTLEDMLRAYVAPYHDDWDDHLLPAEFAYNDSMNPSIGYSPFYLNYGFHPNTPLSLVCKTTKEGDSEQIKSFFARTRADFQNAKNTLRSAQERQAKYANKRRQDCTFVVGDKVWLAADHLKLPPATNASRKLQPRYYGPYRVSAVISPVAYKLDLPKTFRIHPVIHISHMKANADGSKDFPDRPEYQQPPPPQVFEKEEFFLVEAIRNHRHVRRNLQFRIKWLGYGEDENTWISAKQLQADMTPESYQELLDTYVRNSNAKLAITMVIASLELSPQQQFTNLLC